MRSLRRLLGFLSPYRWMVVLAMVTLTGTVVLDLAVPRLIQQIIDQGIVPRDIDNVVRTTALMLGLSLLSAALGIANTVTGVRAAQSYSADLRSALYRKVQSLSFGNLDRLETGHLLVRLTSDVTMVQQVVLMLLRIFVRAPLMIVGAVLMMLITSWRLALVMLVLLPTVLVIVTLFSRTARALFTEVQRRLDRLNAVLQENLSGVRVVKAFVRADHESARFARANEDLAAQTTRVMRLLSLVLPTLMGLLNMAMVAVVWFGGLQNMVGSMTVGEVVAFTNYMLTVTFPVMMMGMMVAQLSAAEASAGRLVEIFDTAPDIAPPPAPRAEAPRGGRVAFENVTFGYDGAGQEAVLTGIDLVAEPGETVAILGATGSGKSSLVHLIPRFYDVQQGRVTVDGVDVRDYDLDALRGRIGIAMQEAVLFSGTVRDNIRYGRRDATDEEVEAAACAAQAHEFIAQLPQRYDTVIGQRGVNLSGGQKQRLAIARALLVQPSVLILDDSTSAVDIETEGRIQDALQEVRAERTAFVVAQRISTVLSADKIAILDRGQVVAVGNHAQLMATSPIYQEIYQSQLGNGEAIYG